MSAFFLEEAHPRYDAFTNYCKSCLLFAFPKMLQCHPQHFREAVCKDYRKEAMTESHVGLKGRQAEEWEIRIPLVCWYLNPPHVWVPRLCCWALFHTILKKNKSASVDCPWMPWSPCVQNSNPFYFLRILLFEDDLLRTDERWWIFFLWHMDGFSLNFSSLWQGSLYFSHPCCPHSSTISPALCGQLCGTNLKRDSWDWCWVRKHLIFVQLKSKWAAISHG